MTRIYTDGAEFQDLLFFSSTSGSPTADTTTFRSGLASYKMDNNESGSKSITALSEAYFRLAFYISADPGTILSWYSGATVLGSLRRNSTSKFLELYTSTGTLVDTGAIAIQATTWYVIEVHVNIHDSTGALDVRVDGVDDAAFAGDTKPGAATTFDLILYHGGANTSYYDDLAMNDTAGGSDDSWCGDGKVILLKPNANGDVSGLTGSDADSTDNYLLVDDFPHDTDTTYTEGSVTDDYDSYNLAASGLTSVSILRVFAECRARDTVAEGGTMALMLETNATEYTGSDQALLTSYLSYKGTQYTTNPQTTIAWTVAELDALQAGFKVRP